MKNFCFNTICSITQEPQELQRYNRACRFISKSAVIKCHQLLWKVTSINRRSLFDQLSTKLIVLFCPSQQKVAQFPVGNFDVNSTVFRRASKYFYLLQRFFFSRYFIRRRIIDYARWVGILTCGYLWITASKLAEINGIQKSRLHWWHWYVSRRNYIKRLQIFFALLSRTSCNIHVCLFNISRL